MTTVTTATASANTSIVVVVVVSIGVIGVLVAAARPPAVFSVVLLDNLLGNTNLKKWEDGDIQSLKEIHLSEVFLFVKPFLGLELFQFGEAFGVLLGNLLVDLFQPLLGGKGN